MNYLIVLPMGIIVAAFWIWGINSWGYGDAHIKFNDFIKYYNKDPHKWYLGTGYVHLKPNSYNFNFGMIDYYRYVYWHNTIKKHKTKQTLEKIFGDKEE